MPRILVAIALSCLLLTARAAERTVLVFGDSLSAGYGIAAQHSWPALLAARLAALQPAWRLVNASVSGETTAGGRSRLAAALERTRPDVVIIELGANDGLRGLPLDPMRDNLQAMIAAARAGGARVLLVGMRLPPNFGADYSGRFAAVYRDLARREKVALLPFLLEPLGTGPEHFQGDGLHPLATAQPALLDHVWPALQPLLK